MTADKRLSECSSTVTIYVQRERDFFWFYQHGILAFPCANVGHKSTNIATAAVDFASNDFPVGSVERRPLANTSAFCKMTQEKVRSDCLAVLHRLYILSMFFDRRKIANICLMQRNSLRYQLPIRHSAWPFPGAIQ